MTYKKGTMPDIFDAIKRTKAKKHKEKATGEKWKVIYGAVIKKNRAKIPFHRCSNSKHTLLNLLQENEFITFSLVKAKMKIGKHSLWMLIKHLRQDNHLTIKTVFKNKKNYFEETRYYLIENPINDKN